MKKVLVFEHTEFNEAFEKKFFHFCIKRQLTLSKYIMVYFFYAVLRYWGIISREKYYRRRWSFLKDVRNIEDRANKFWMSSKNKLTGIASGSNVIWISEYPRILLNELAAIYKVTLIANIYDISSSEFLFYQNIYGLFLQLDYEERLQIYDSFPSRLRKIKDADFIIVYNKKTFCRLTEYCTYRIGYIIFIFFLLFIMAIFIGLVSLFFAPAGYSLAIYLSYFKKPLILLLNIFPIFLLIFFLFFITNRVWLSFVMAYIAIMLLTWVNYFKLIFRNDPLLAADLVLISESADMAGKYDINLNWQIILALLVFMVIIAVTYIYVKGKLQFVMSRLCAIALVLVIGFFTFNNIYMNSKVYAATENNSLINRWSPTQLYISRGFLYPFLYSIKSSIPKPPVGYEPIESRNSLYSFDYSNIPDERKVNIITIMLEAYNDFTKFKEIDFNLNVYEYLHELQQESYHGEIVTNVFAGNTINTERCFLTGYTKLFNFRKHTNSYVHYFKEQEYTVEGSHPCYDWFYNRKNVNSYLGFESYYYFENYYSQLANGAIARDNILFPHIIKLYEENKSTNKPYFSFNVTYQNHGPYSTDRKTDNYYIQNKGYTEAEYNIMNNYFSGIYDTNQHMKKLIDYFKMQNEPIVVILFGDHNPWMGDNNSVYKMLGINFDFGSEEGFYNYYNTPYIIWGNEKAKKILDNPLEGEGPMISPNFLMNEFFELAGYEGNEFMKLSNELRKLTDVVHDKKIYKEFGQLTTELTDETQTLLNDFIKVQYYWSRKY